MASNVILATGGYDHTVCLWDCNVASAYMTLQFADSQVCTLSFSPDHEHLAVGGYCRAVLYDVSSSNSRPFKVFGEHRGNVTALGYEPGGGWLYSASDDGTVKTWDARSTGAQRVFSGGDSAAINCAAMHPDGVHIFFGDDAGRLRVWNSAQEKLALELRPQSHESIETLAISTDGRLLVAASRVGACFAWKIGDDATKLASICRLQAHSRHVLKLALSRDDVPMLAAACDDGSVKLWLVDQNAAETEGSLPLLSRLPLHERWVWDVAFPSESRTFFTASSDKLSFLVNVERGAVEKEFKGHTKAVTCLAIAEVT